MIVVHTVVEAQPGVLGRCVWDDGEGRCIDGANGYDGLCGGHRIVKRRRMEWERLFEEGEKLVEAYQGLSPKKLARKVCSSLRRAVREGRIARSLYRLTRGDAKAVFVFVLASKRRRGRPITWGDFLAAKRASAIPRLDPTDPGWKFNFSFWESYANRYFGGAVEADQQ